MSDLRRSTASLVAILLGLTIPQACAFLSCTDELGMEVRPRVATLAPGETFTPTLHLDTCDGRKTIVTSVVWESSDTAVVQVVDPVSGRSVARGAGTAEVFASSQRYGTFPPILVNVR